MKNEKASDEASRVPEPTDPTVHDPISVRPGAARPFLSDIQEIRRRAREHISRGAVTPSYVGDVNLAVRVLNEALATEIVCTLRYRSHYFMADGLESESVKQEFLEHAQEEEAHASQISERIRQLGGVPDWNPANLVSRSHAEFEQGETLLDMIEEDLIAERIAIESYREMIRFFGQNDPTSRRLMEEILAKEEEHAEDLASLLVRFDKRPAASAAS
ncbi:MAG TPA: ferritin-like domain-containing protein [Bdellovibrionota bacterium]|nr:ferritin-like domain-containing protein [Bdellovibrionota bacterium]